MAESDQRRKVLRELRGLHAIPIENKIGAGTPDVNFSVAGGWIELKWLRHWPKRESTPVRIEHFTQVQRIWLKRRWDRAGDAWLLLQVRREWLLFTGRIAAEYIGSCTREELYEVARARWSAGLIGKELMECLKKTMA